MEDKEFSVLIVDDDTFNINILLDILSPYYNVLVANSGNGAIRRSILEKPDLILLDIVMPNINGFDTLVRLKEIDETRHIPIIFITGLDSYEDEEKGLFLGAVDYIRKPFHSSIVKARVKTQIQIVKQMRTIEKSIMIDFLLDIANRRYFDKQMNLEWHRATRKQHFISLLMIDVDHFKHYNDTYGHPQGDLMLQSVAKILTIVANRPRDVVARYGGEELAVILPETDLEEALKMAETMRQRVQDNEVLCIDKHEPTKVTISIGVVSRAPAQTDRWKNIVIDVDKALYEAKNSGRNKVCYNN